MKIAIGYDIKQSSWGGGNQFAISLVKAAKDQGHKITYHLIDKDIDIIVMMDPRSYNVGINFGSLGIIKYLIFQNKNAVVVHRINECDERKNTFHVNKLLKWANYSADFTIFISSWLKNLNLFQRDKPSKVILNGGDKHIFKNYNNNIWDGFSPLKIVTHHWSPNKMKGFDVYKKLDELLSSSKFRKQFEFTYIGNLPKGFKFQNTKHINPLSGEKLGKELSKHHLYISASINEPAGMHHIEGILCGLPIIYRQSGALPEYCKDYGIAFENQNFLPALKKMLSNYSIYKKNIIKYPHNSEKMTKEYLDLFKELLLKRNQIIKKRSLLKSPFILILNLVFLILQVRNIVKSIYWTILKKKYLMKLIFLLLRELKDWFEFFIRHLPGKTGYFLRSFYYKMRLKDSFSKNRFESGLRIEFPKNIKLGSNSFFGLDCKIYASEFSQIKIGSNITFNSNVMINARGKGKILIGNNVLIGPNAVLRSNNHSFENKNKPIKEQGMSDGDIFIEDDVWISSNSVILPNCRIGKGAIIAAGAVVTNNVASYSIVGGIPAKEISKRDFRV